MYAGERSCVRPLLPHRLDDDALRALPVPLAVEDALPRAEVQTPIGDWDDDLVANGQRSEMRGRVVLPGAAVVAVPLGVPGRDVVLEPVEDVLPQSRLVVVDEHGRG